MTFRLAPSFFSSDAARSWRVAAAVAAFSAALPAEASAAGTVRLRYGFKPQSAYAQTIGVDLDVAADPKSTPAPLLTLLQSMIGEVKQHVSAKSRLETKTRNADGSLPLQYKVVEAKGTTIQGGQSKPMPALDQAPSKPPADGRVAADGRRLTLDPPGEGTEGIPKRVLERVADAFPVLPEKELKIGDTFESRTVMTLPGPGRVERPVETVWVYTLKSFDGKAATFDVRQTLPKEAPAPAADGKSLDLAGGGSGTAVFDVAAGLFSSIKMDLDLALTTDLPLPAGLTLGGGGATTTKPDGTTGPAPNRIKVLVKGPMVMTLAPS